MFIVLIVLFRFLREYFFFISSACPPKRLVCDPGEENMNIFDTVLITLIRFLANSNGLVLRLTQCSVCNDPEPPVPPPLRISARSRECLPAL